MPLPRKAILLLLDSLPLGELGCYGGFSEKTPGFDRLAAQGAVFENAYTPAVIDDGSAFEERGPWFAAWHEFAAGLRRDGCELKEIVCTTLAALTDAASSEQVEAFLNRPERGALVISGPELVPPPVHGHLAVVDEAVATLHAAIESAGEADTLLIVGALQGAAFAGDKPAVDTDDDEEIDDEESDDEVDAEIDETDGSLDEDEPWEEPFPRLSAGRVNIPLLLWTPAPVVPGMRIQALATTSDIPATLVAWLSPESRKPLGVDGAGLGGLDLLPLVDCLEESVRNEILIRGPGEIALRTLDRYVVVRLDEPAGTLDGEGERGEHPRDNAPDTVAVFRKPQDVWDRLDVGNTMPEERDMLVHRCRTLFAEAAG